MKDFLGNELKVGDRVAYLMKWTAGCQRLIEGYVIGFSPAQIRIGDTPDSKSGLCKIVEHVVKINEP